MQTQTKDPKGATKKWGSIRAELAWLESRPSRADEVLRRFAFIDEGRWSLKEGRS